LAGNGPKSNENIPTCIIIHFNSTHNMSSIAQGLIAEIQHEAENTRQYFQNIDPAHFDWKPNDKSMTLLKLAIHVAECMEWVGYTMKTEGINFTDSYESPVAKSVDELIQLLNKNVEDSIDALSKATDADFMVNWKATAGDHVVFEMSRLMCVRGMCLNHFYHHRGQLSVYFNMLNIRRPAIYGPTADDKVTA
jgi:uncharacterized damage-inducible protein DinB